VDIGFASELSDIFEKADIENYMLINQPMSAPSPNYQNIESGLFDLRREFLAGFKYQMNSPGAYHLDIRDIPTHVT